MATPDPESFLEAVAESIDGVTKDDLAIDMNLSGIPVWDSLAKLTVLTEIEERFGSVISLADLGDCRTLEDLRLKI